MNIMTLLQKAADINASDLHITTGIPPMMRVCGRLTPAADEIVTPDIAKNIAKEIMSNEQWEELSEKGECDFGMSTDNLRFRINVFMQQQNVAIALRLIRKRPPNINELGLPPVVQNLCTYNRGLVLVTGPTGSGKSTTLASMIDLINSTQNRHILTLEDPIEYLHDHKQSIINQREIGTDSDSYSTALRAGLRQDPDIILVGEMRDLETISIALTAAETGHLVLSTLHTTGAAKTINRIIDVFPPHQQQQIRTQLSMTLVGIVSQQLLPSNDSNERVVAAEVMLASTAIRNLIRENKVHQAASAMQAAAPSGMQLMDDALVQLYRKGMISRDTAVMYAMDKSFIDTML